MAANECETMSEGLLMIDPQFTHQMKQMKQLCKVCEEPAAGFHFGAFTCEGCKSFFGRCAASADAPRVPLPPCKSEGKCSVLGRARTNCKQCRYDKCVRVGMSRERSRFGRRSHYFKVHEYMGSRDGDDVSLGPSPPASASPGSGKVPIHKPLAIIPPPPFPFTPQPSPAGVLTPPREPFAHLALLFPHLFHQPYYPEPAGEAPEAKKARVEVDEVQSEPLDLSQNKRKVGQPLDLRCSK